MNRHRLQIPDHKKGVQSCRCGCGGKSEYSQDSCERETGVKGGIGRKRSICRESVCVCGVTVRGKITV